MKKIIFTALGSLTIFLAILLPGLFIQDNNLILGGSTSVSALFNNLKTASIENEILKPDFNYYYHSMGSSAGFKRIIDKTFDVGFFSRNITTDEFNKYNQQLKKQNAESELKQFLLVKDHLIFVYHLPEGCETNNNQPIDFNKKLLNDIYLKEKVKWSSLTEVTCQDNDNEIIRINREHGSGTRSSFEKLIFEESEVSKYHFEQQFKSTTHIIKQVQEIPGTLVYLTSAAAKDIQKLKNDLVQIGTLDNKTFEDDNYRFSRPFVGVYIEKNKEKLTELLKYLEKEEIKSQLNNSNYNYALEKSYTKTI